MRDSQEEQVSEAVSNSLDLTKGPDATQIDGTRKSTESKGLRMEGDLILNRYLLIERLGKGTQGEVWKVFDQQVKMQSALKFLPPDFQHSPAKHAELTRCFRLCYALHHRGLCQLKHLDTDPKHGMFLVMEYIDGIRLDRYRLELLRRSKNDDELGASSDVLPLSKVIALLRPVAEGLDALHVSSSDSNMCLLHRDVKPSNILVTRNNDSSKLIDFGIAELVQSEPNDANIAGTKTLNGTLPYMAPEILRNQTADARSDQYSLAVVVCEFISGKHPFTIVDSTKLKQSILNDPPLILGVNPRAMKVLERALSKSSHDRYNSCTDFFNELERSCHDPKTHSTDKKKTISAEDFLQEEQLVTSQLRGCHQRLEQANRRIQRLANPINISVLGLRNSGKSSLLFSWYHRRATPGITLRITDDTSVKYFENLKAQLASSGSVAATYISQPDTLNFDVVCTSKLAITGQTIEFQACVQDYAGELVRKRHLDLEEPTDSFASEVQSSIRQSNVVLCLVDVLVEESELSNIFDLLLNDGEIEVVLLVITKFDLVLKMLNKTEYPRTNEEFAVLAREIAQRQPRFGILWNQIQALQSDMRRSRQIVPVAALGIDYSEAPEEETAYNLCGLKPFQPLQPLVISAEILAEKRDRLLAEKRELTKEIETLNAQLKKLRVLQQQEIGKLENHFEALQTETTMRLEQLDTDIHALKQLERRCLQQQALCKQWKAGTLVTKYDNKLALIRSTLAVGESHGRTELLKEMTKKLDSSSLRKIKTPRGLLRFLSVTFSSSTEPALALLPSKYNDDLREKYRSVQWRVAGRCVLILVVVAIFLGIALTTVATFLAN
ncbi:MAG: hypothetical protein RLY14_2187 [Planctomycetota bacterium]|jgi:serine/threonine protein kinase